MIYPVLDDLFTANSLDDLAKMVLKCPEESGVTYKKFAQQVNAKIQRFINENKENFFASELPVLEKIHGLLPTEKYKTRLEQSKHGSKLRETIESVIELIKNKPDFPTLPQVLMSECEDYSSMYECFNRFLAGITSSQNRLGESIANADVKEIANFVDDARRKRTSHPYIFQKMISKFFQLATPHAQSLFFSCIAYKESDFLNEILAVLPINLPRLYLVNSGCIRDLHLKTIAKRLINLEILHLSFNPNSSPVGNLVLKITEWTDSDSKLWNHHEYVNPLTDTCLMALVVKLKKLTYLDFCWKDMQIKKEAEKILQERRERAKA